MYCYIRQFITLWCCDADASCSGDDARHGDGAVVGGDVDGAERDCDDADDDGGYVDEYDYDEHADGNDACDYIHADYDVGAAGDVADADDDDGDDDVDGVDDYTNDYGDDDAGDYPDCDDDDVDDDYDDGVAAAADEHVDDDDDGDDDDIVLRFWIRMTTHPCSSSCDRTPNVAPITRTDHRMPRRPSVYHAWLHRTSAHGEPSHQLLGNWSDTAELPRCDDTCKGLIHVCHGRWLAGDCGSAASAELRVDSTS